MCQYYLRKHCSVILLQMIMVSPGTHLAKKNWESKCRTIESQFKKQWLINWFFGGLYVTMQTINLKTNSKTDQNSVLRFSGTKKLLLLLNNSCKNSHRNHMNSIFYKNIFRSTDRSLHCTGRMPWIIILRPWHFLCIRDAGCRGNKITDCCCCFLVNGYLKVFCSTLHCGHSIQTKKKVTSGSHARINPV